MLTLDRNRTALLVMDLQVEILAMVGEAAAPLLDKAASALDAARQAGLPVLHVALGFRAGYPELAPNNPITALVKPSGRFQAAPEASIHPAVKPLPEEPVVAKRRVGAFAGTDLAMLLRARGIETLVLVGFATSGVVLSTLRQAADMDYKQVILSDACADGDSEVHRVLMEKVFPRQATIMSVADFVGAIA